MGEGVTGRSNNRIAQRRESPVTDEALRIELEVAILLQNAVD